MAEIHASLLNADFSKLDEQLASLADVDAFHIDVMDGRFVPADTRERMNPQLLQHLPEKKPKSVHLMVERPVDYFHAYGTAGATEIIFHVEAAVDPAADLAAIRSLGIRAGLSLKPATPLTALDPYLKKLDSILVMSVEPGKGGQEFISESLERVRQLRALAPDVFICVDGGVKATNAASVIAAGANAVVIGSGLFKSNTTPAAALAEVREALDRARP